MTTLYAMFPTKRVFEVPLSAFGVVVLGYKNSTNNIINWHSMHKRKQEKIKIK